jgi:hypothetical protein
MASWHRRDRSRRVQTQNGALAVGCGRTLRMISVRCIQRSFYAPNQATVFVLASV